MELNIMELKMDELKKVSGGENAGSEHERIVKMMEDLIQRAREWNRSYEDAINLAIYAFGDEVSEAEIRAYARAVYGR